MSLTLGQVAVSTVAAMVGVLGPDWVKLLVTSYAEVAQASAPRSTTDLNFCHPL